MRAVVQRALEGSVKVDNQIIGRIGKGVVVLLGVSKDDTSSDIKYLVEKIINLRIFNDSDEKMNFSLLDIEGEALIVSQFTLYGDCRKGRRPSYTEAASPELANELYEAFVNQLWDKGLKVATGQFQAHMEVSLINDGPVTILLDSKKGF